MLPKIKIKGETVIHHKKKEVKLQSTSLREDFRPSKKEALLWDEIAEKPTGHIWVGSHVQDDVITHYYRSLLTGHRRVWGNTDPNCKN